MKLRVSDCYMIIGVVFIAIGEVIYQKEKKAERAKSEEVWTEADKEFLKTEPATKVEFKTDGDVEFTDPPSTDEIPFATD